MKPYVFALMGGLAFSTACAQSDAGITTSVKTQLATDDLVKARTIDVDTKDGVVTLTGTVQTPGEEIKALEIARTARGVTNVIDNIAIASSAEPQAAPTSGRFGETPGAIARPVLDSGLTAEVKTRLLADPAVSGLRIDVDTSERVVTLTGTVGSQAEKDRALAIARGVENVARVEDKLTLR